MSWLSKITGGGKSSASPGSSGTSGKERPANPPMIVIDHHDYTPEEFALGSFRIRPYDGDLIAKQQFDFNMVFDLGNDPVNVACRGFVVKMNEQTGLVARYQSPQPFYERKLIDYIRAWKGI